MTVIYVMAYNQNGPSKIGISNNPSRRLREIKEDLRTSLAKIKLQDRSENWKEAWDQVRYDLKVYSTFQFLVKYPGIEHTIEQAILKDYRSINPYGEWVEIAPSVVVHKLSLVLNDESYWEIDNWEDHITPGNNYLNNEIPQLTLTQSLASHLKKLGDKKFDSGK